MIVVTRDSKPATVGYVRHCTGALPFEFVTVREHGLCGSFSLGLVCVVLCCFWLVQHRLEYAGDSPSELGRLDRAMAAASLVVIDEDELIRQERVGTGAYGDVFRSKWHGKVWMVPAFLLWCDVPAAPSCADGCRLLLAVLYCCCVAPSVGHT